MNRVFRPAFAAMILLSAFGLFANRSAPSGVPVASVYFNTRTPAVIAHRGAADEEARRGGFHEGTIAAYRYAADLGVDVLEMDVHKTADGRLAVHHDDKLPKTCSGKSHAHELTMAQLKACRTTLGYEIPELREIFRAFPTYRMTIEMKTPKNSLIQSYSGIASLLWNEIRTHKMESRVSVSSVHGGQTGDFRALVRGLPTGLSAPEQVAFLLCYVARLPQWACAGVPRNATHLMETPYFHKDLALLGINLGSISLVTSGFVSHARSYDYRVNYWTVNGSAEIQRVYQAGAAGVITDNPARALSLRP